MSCKPQKDPNTPGEHVTPGCILVTPYLTGTNIYGYQRNKNNVLETNLLTTSIVGWNLDDTITGTSQIGTGLITNYPISTRDGSDNIFGKGLSAGMHGRYDNGHGIWASNTINTGSGADSLKGVAHSRGRAALFVTSDIRTVGGSDKIKGVGHTATGIRIGSYIGGATIVPGAIRTGDGNDRLIGVNTSSSNGSALMIEDGLINMGKGNDKVDISEGGYSNNSNTVTPNGEMSPGGSVNLGSGDDIFIGFMKLSTSSKKPNKGKLDGGHGYDVIEIDSGTFTFNARNHGGVIEENKYTSLRITSIEEIQLGSNVYDVNKLSNGDVISG